jgi:hypothetical protein
MQKICFEEKQCFREIAFFILLDILQVLFLWGMISQVFLGKPWGRNPSDWHAQAKRISCIN